MNGSRQYAAAAASVSLLVLAPPLRAQQADTIRPVELAPVVVTTERVRTPLASSTSAVSRISPEELRAMPARTINEVLESVPGLTFLDVDGTGFDPQLTLRGFYGGGEAEYVVVLLDGRPLNGLESGLVDWEQVPLSALAAVEVVRGGASSLYGDAAVGGVINLLTRGGSGPGRSVSVGAGSLGTWRGAANLRADWGERPVSLYASFRRAEGYRQRAERTTGSAGGTMGVLGGARGELNVSTLHHWRAYEEPGPLTAAELADSRTRVHPFYRFDTVDEQLHRASVDGRARLGQHTEAGGFLTAEARRTEGVRTLPLSPEFADTKERELDTYRLLGSAQLRWGDGALPASGGLLLGSDWSAGRLENRHYQVVTGGEPDYRSASGARGELDARGTGTRLAAGGFARYELRPAESLRVTAGGRVDWLRDSFQAELPARDEHRNTHVAFSPQAGVNYRYLQRASQAGHVFLNAGRSFKAPTPDQLFDQRALPAPFPPYRLTLSNPELEPATGTSIEAGLYHDVQLGPRGPAASLSLAAYQLDMEDELDVDLATFRYVNIGRSRHRGVEAGLSMRGSSGLGGYANYTLQAVTFRNGEYRGNALKAIPRHAVAAGVRAGRGAGPSASLGSRTVWGVYLDDANAIELPGYTRLDARLSYSLGRVRLDVEVFNLGDREYSTTGYPDPAGSGTVYYYPAAGRTLQLGITTEW